MDKKIILFGAGKIGRKALLYYGEEKIEAFCDNNPRLQGQLLEGKRIIDFEKLIACYKEYQVILSIKGPSAIRAVSKQLRNANIPFTVFDENQMENFDTNKEIFTNIYKCKLWGDEKGSAYFSGSGSREPEIVDPYISLLVRLIKANDINSITEIGCGDFYIMNNVFDLLSRSHNPYKYLGIDLVEDLCNYNNTKFGSDCIRFVCMDVSEDDVDLPPGDMLIIRQVLQHLSNETIKKILNKISKFHFVLITEHIYEGADAIFNLDKSSGSKIRLDFKSGVYLECPPYNYKNIVHLLKVYQMGGTIRTSLIIN